MRRASTIMAAVVFFAALAEFHPLTTGAAEWSRRVPALTCANAWLPTQPPTPNPSEPFIQRGAVYPVGNARRFDCPIPDDTRFPKDRATLVTVTGFLYSSNQVSVNVCALRPLTDSVFGEPQITCTRSRTLGPQIPLLPFAITFPADELAPVWGVEGDFAFVEVVFARGDGRSLLTGIYVIGED